MRKVDGYGDGVAVAAVTVASQAEEGNYDYERGHFGSVALENHVQGHSNWTPAEGGRVAACPWGLPPRYRRNHHLTPGDLPLAHRCTSPHRHRRKCSAHQLTSLCCCPHERTTLGADNRGDSHQWLGPASLSSVAGQIPSAPALGTSSADLVSSAAGQDQTHHWRPYGPVS